MVKRQRRHDKDLEREEVNRGEEMRSCILQSKVRCSPAEGACRPDHEMAMCRESVWERGKVQARSCGGTNVSSKEQPNEGSDETDERYGLRGFCLVADG